MPDQLPFHHRILTAKYAWIILFLSCLLLFLAGIKSLPPTDRDESRFAQASKQMVESGDYLDIRFQETPRYKKPAGIYWLQSAAVKVSGQPVTSIWPYRLPSAMGALIAVIVTCWLGNHLFDRQTGLLAGLLLGGSLLLNVEAHLAKTDAMMLSMILIMQTALCLLYQKRQTDAALRPALIFWLACGAGVLIKGPIPLVIALSTIVILSVSERSTRLIRSLRPLLGVVILCAMVLPWFFAIQKLSHGAFAEHALLKDFLPKLLSGQESHGAPPGYYLLLFPVFFWPGSILAIRALPQLWRQRQDDKIRFLLAWILPAWLIFELVPTKLPHYVLPFFPAITLLTAHAIMHGKSGQTATRLWQKGLHWFGGLVWLSTTLILGIGLPVLGITLNHVQLVQLLPFIGALVSIWVAWRYVRHRNPDGNMVLLLFVGALLVFPAAFSIILPQIDIAWPSRHIAYVLADQPEGELVSIGFNEPSLPFLVGTKTLMVPTKQALERFPEELYRYLLVEKRQQKKHPDEINQLTTGLKQIDHFVGYNYSKGDNIVLDLYAKP